MTNNGTVLTYSVEKVSLLDINELIEKGFRFKLVEEFNEAEHCNYTEKVDDGEV